MPDAFEPTLRTVFVEQACEVFYRAFDEANPDMIEYRRAGGKYKDTWTSLTSHERATALAAMDATIAWMDSRRL